MADHRPDITERDSRLSYGSELPPQPSSQNTHLSQFSHYSVSTDIQAPQIGAQPGTSKREEIGGPISTRDIAALKVSSLDYQLTENEQEQVNQFLYERMDDFFYAFNPTGGEVLCKELGLNRHHYCGCVGDVVFEARDQTKRCGPTELFRINAKLVTLVAQGSTCQLSTQEARIGRSSQVISDDIKNDFMIQVRKAPDEIKKLFVKLTNGAITLEEASKPIFEMPKLGNVIKLAPKKSRFGKTNYKGTVSANSQPITTNPPAPQTYIPYQQPPVAAPAPLYVPPAQQMGPYTPKYTSDNVKIHQTSKRIARKIALAATQSVGAMEMAHAICREIADDFIYAERVKEDNKNEGINEKTYQYIYQAFEASGSTFLKKLYESIALHPELCTVQGNEKESFAEKVDKILDSLLGAR